ncbi:MAG TPA: DnaJ domain-containing protein [Propionicimonas sp.]|jgi:curved DNA-binding protein CbpA
MAENYYERLGVSPDATEEQIEAAIDGAIREIQGRKRKSAKDEAEIQRLVSLRDVLLDPDSREAYDAALARGELEPVSDPSDGPAFFMHYAIYGGERRSGFGKGELVSVRNVNGPDLLTIRFKVGDREIIANHPGLEPIDA